MSAHWDVKQFISNIIVKEIDTFKYYLWNKLPKKVQVVEGNILEGDIVYRAQELYNRANISSKSEYTFLKFENGYAQIKKSKYQHTKSVMTKELCRKDESSYARRKRIEILEISGEVFFDVDEETQKKINKKLKK